MTREVLSIPLVRERNVVTARQQARHIAGLLGFDVQDQARLATAVSEIARNAVSYGGGGTVQFSIEGLSAPQIFMIEINDRGPGIADLPAVLGGTYRSPSGMGIGISGARRLVDQCDIRSERGKGTSITLKKLFPASASALKPHDIARINDELLLRAPASPYEELQQQHRELLRALSELRERQEQLESVNDELEDTNRGVVALYAELELKADHLRRADEMKSRFLSNMSHEFRTPLNSIRALSGLLLDHVDGPLSGEQEKQVGFIRKSAQDLSTLVEDLLDLAKIEAGRIEVNPVEFSVANLFSALRGMLRPLLVSDAVVLRFESAENLPELHTDEAKVSQILRNFISNALKFTERGEVRVESALSADGTMIDLTVTDTGIGIAPADLETIFEEFVQVRNPLQRRVKGTGLGLPLCKNLAHLLGGSISVTSVPGSGSSFRASIPVRYAEPKEADTPDAPAPVVDISRIPVLVVEDQPELLLFYDKILRGTAFQVLPAKTVREAREQLRLNAPAAIILDIVLKGEDTWHWLGELKSDPETQHIPVVVVSEVPEPRKGIALGATAYLSKPIERAQLLAELNEALGARILIIDDDAATRYGVRRLLANAGYFVHEASDGESGLQTARTTHPQLIVLDLGLPDVDGSDLLARLKLDEQTRDIPVVVATARDISTVDLDALELHARAVLTKRELLDRVVTTVTALLETA